MTLGQFTSLSLIDKIEEIKRMMKEGNSNKPDDIFNNTIKTDDIFKDIFKDKI